MRPLDLVGRTFGRLFVASRNGSLRGRALWMCRCECGRVSAATSDDLVSGNTTSCGCVLSETRLQATRTHGHAGHGNAGPGRSVEYRIWCGMITRCTNERRAGYENYGGRGIAVCQRWRESFEAFLEDMGCRPSPQHSIDRKDNDGNYEPGNCRWATRSEQRLNQRPTLQRRQSAPARA